MCKPEAAAIGINLERRAQPAKNLFVAGLDQGMEGEPEQTSLALELNQIWKFRIFTIHSTWSRGRVDETIIFLCPSNSS